MGNTVDFNPKQLIQESKGNNSFLKRLTKEKLEETLFPLAEVREKLQDELSELEESLNRISFLIGILLIASFYLLLMANYHSMESIGGTIGLLSTILLCGLYAKKRSLILAYQVILRILESFEHDKIKSLNLSSVFLDYHDFFKDFEKKIHLYGGDCKCYVYYKSTDETKFYKSYSICEDSIWSSKAESNSMDTADKIGVMTTTLQYAYDLFDTQLKRYKKTS